jgi:hypothetical protein
MIDQAHDPDTDEQLRRRLRALSAVNEQLRAQLDATQTELRTAPRQPVASDPLDERSTPVPVGLAPRRAAIAEDWLGQLPPPSTGDLPELVETEDGTLFVLDGGARRRVRSGLLAAALEQLLGERRRVTEAELGDRPEAAPVEVLEGANGLPFVVLDGRRLRIRGLPLPHPVDQLVAGEIAYGPDLDLPVAVTPRRANEANGWIVTLQDVGDAVPRLVTDPDGVCSVVEGSVRRTVRSALLVPALEAVLGGAQPATAEELAALTEGPDVEVLEARTGEPFVVLGGRRSRLLGFPVPYPVLQDRADALADGPPLDVAGAFRAIQRDLTDTTNTATGERDRAVRKVARVQAQLDDERRAAAARRANPDPATELRRLIDKRGGVGPTLTRFAKNRVRKLVRRGAKPKATPKPKA